MSAVFLEGIEGDPENALGNALGYAQNLMVGETPRVAMLSYAANTCVHAHHEVPCRNTFCTFWLLLCLAFPVHGNRRHGYGTKPEAFGLSLF